MLEEPEIALDAIRHAIDAAGPVVVELFSGARTSADGHTIRVLHPPRERLMASDNANSLVLQIDSRGKTLILPGDLEPPGSELLVRADRPPPGGVLMAPHHGSLRMDAAAVLQWARPSETVVSGGQRRGDRRSKKCSPSPDRGSTSPATSVRFVSGSIERGESKSDRGSSRPGK